LQFAVVYCNAELYNKKAATKGMNMFWQWCRIDAEPRAMKCNSCGALGHLTKFCDKGEVVNQIRMELEDRNECLDCILYNTINANDRNRQMRPTHHKKQYCRVSNLQKLSEA